MQAIVLDDDDDDECCIEASPTRTRRCDRDTPTESVPSGAGPGSWPGLVVGTACGVSYFGAQCTMPDPFLFDSWESMPLIPAARVRHVSLDPLTHRLAVCSAAGYEVWRLSRTPTSMAAHFLRAVDAALLSPAREMVEQEDGEWAEVTVGGSSALPCPTVACAFSTQHGQVSPAPLVRCGLLVAAFRSVRPSPLQWAHRKQCVPV